MRADIALKNAPFDEIAAYAEFAQAFAAMGAVASFAGRVRPQSPDGTIDALYLDWYPGMSEASLETIGAAALARFDVAAVRIWHRCAEVRAGDVIVLVCAAADHRRPALEAVDYMMDRLKSEAALWKRETGTAAGGGTIDRWVEPADRDRADLARWDKD